jgi:hypothetical protein
MSHLPNRDGRNEGDEPLWAVEPLEPAWEDPTPEPQARAWFSVAERRFGLPTRIASRAAGLIAVGALMTTGVAIAAFADDGTSSAAGDKPFCSEVVTTECVDKAKEKAPEPAAPAEEPKPAAEPAPAPAAEPDPPAASSEESTPADPPAASTPQDAPASDPAPSDAPAPTGDAPATPDDTTPASSDAPAPGGGSAPADTTGQTGGQTADPGAASDTATPDAPAATPDVPVTNPLPPAPVGTTPTTTAVTAAPGDLSALAGLESSAGSTYFQLPSGRGSSGSAATAQNGGVAGGLSNSGGANDIHAVGISALALLQLQRASSLLPPPAPLPDIRELDVHALTQMRQVSKRTHVSWNVLASVQRLGLHKGQSLTAAGKWLKKHGATGNSAKPFTSEKALAAYFGSKDAGERAAALAAYYWAVGTAGVTRGLVDASATLGDEVLAAKNVSVYAAGRADLQQRRIDPRVEMTIRYLQASFGSVSVSCLISGHSVFTSSGNVSAHIFGRAVDISAVGGTTIVGHQGPQTVTERAIRLLLMLPGDVAPRQIISLMDLDGTTGNAGSFALPDHADHIHIGY